MLLALLACNGPDDSPVDSTPSADATWYADVEPLVYEKCSSCHTADGVGGADLTDYEVASASGELLAAYVEAREMPLPAADPECRPYVGHERMNLTDDERQLLVDWARGGAPLGDEAERAEGLEMPVTTLQDTDAELPMFEAHELQLEANGNEYYCMVLDNPFEETTWITGIDVELGTREVVHHMVLAVDANKDAGIEYGTDGTEAQFTCKDPVVESDWMLVHAWTPGMEPVEFPEGMGMKIEPDDQIVLQMHYFGDPDETYTDLSAYKLRTADSVDTEVHMTAFGPTSFSIPAGESAATAMDGMTNRGWGDFHILGAFPHMHLLGSYFESWVRHDDGSETCVLQGEYDFDHQMTYMFEEPLVWSDGETLRFRCTWDNSEGTETVRYGEGTDEEMCFMLFYYAQP